MGVLVKCLSGKCLSQLKLPLQELAHDAQWDAPKFDLVAWWESRRQKWPLLAVVAGAWCVFPVTSVEPERAFSRLKVVLEPAALRMRDAVLNARLSLMVNGDLAFSSAAPKQLAIAPVAAPALAAAAAGGLV